MKKRIPELAYEKIGLTQLLILFLISRILDSLSTEILLSRVGFIEHPENFIFYSISNHWIGYFLSTIIMVLFIGLSIYLYNRTVWINKYHLLSPILAVPIWTFFLMSWIAVVNNFLLILGMVPPGIQFQLLFTLLLMLIIIPYSMFLAISIYLELRKERTILQ